MTPSNKSIQELKELINFSKVGNNDPGNVSAEIVFHATAKTGAKVTSGKILLSQEATQFLIESTALRVG